MNEHNGEPVEERDDQSRQTSRRLDIQTAEIQEMSEAEVAVIVHELRVHQVELEMQNDELRKAQVELEQSRTKYAELFDFAPVGYLVFDPNGLIVEANLTATSLLGIERSRLLGKAFSLRVAPAGRDTWHLHYHAVFKTAGKQQCQIEVMGKDETRLVVRLHSRPVLNENGKVVLCHTALADVTALVRAEQRLRDSERRFRTLAENSPDIIVRINADLRIVYANQRVETALGLPAGEVIGRTLGELEAPADMVETWAAAVRQVFGTGKTTSVEFQCELPSGLRYHSAAIAPEFEEDRTIHTVLVTIRDITDRLQAEEKYTTVIHNLQDGFCILDAEGRYLEGNDAYCRMLWRDCDELLQMNVVDVWDPDRTEELAIHLQKTLQDGSDKFLTRHVRKDGSLVDCDVTMQRLNGDRLFVFARDVTEQRAAEKEQMETLQRLDLVAKAAHDGIWDWDLAANVCWHNEAYAAVLGYTPDQVSSDPEWWQQRIHPDDRAKVVSTIQETAQGPGDTWSAKYRFQRSDGSYAWVIDRGYVVRDAQGHARRMVGSTMDLTEKLELVGQLESERAKLATILDTALGAIIVADERGSISYANPAAQKLHGQPMPHGEDLESHARMGLYHLDGTPCEPRDLPLVRSALQGETYNEIELLVKRPDGETRHVMVNANPLADQNGKITGAVAVIQDITELKHAEQALREAHDRLEEQVRGRTAELDAAVASLEEQIAEKTEAQNKLLHQNEVLQKIVNNIPVMLCFFDPAGHVGMINEGFTRVLGYTLEDFREHDLAELCFPPEIRREAWEHLLIPEPQWRDFFAQTKTGERIISSWATVQLADGSYVGIGLDLRERTRFEDCLRGNEQRYRTLVEMSPDAITVERNGVIEFANSTTARLLAVQSAEELIGRFLLDFIHPDYRKRVDRQFARLRRSRKPMQTTEEKIVRADGMALDIELAAMPITFENQPANQVVLRDITQRKQVETKLRDNAMKLQQQAQLLDLAHDSIVVNDMQGRIAFWSRGAEQTYGWTQQEALGQVSHELLKTRFPLNLIEITAKLLSQGRWNGELTHTTRHGETIVVSSRWALQRDEEGRPSGILVIDRDITQQKHAEQTTIEAWQFAESVTNTIQESLLVLDQDLRVVSANQTFYKAFGVSPEDTQGRLIYDLGNRQWDIPELRRLLEDILPHNSTFENYEVEHQFEHIGHRTMLLNARRIYRQSQETQMILLTIVDNTVRKEQERKIHEHQQELATLTEELLLTEERERRQLALLLHDSIGQSLAFSKREIGVLQKSATPNVREALEYVKQQIDESIRQTRDLTFELSPTTLYTFGLEAAVEELAEQFTQRGRFQCHFEATEENKPLSEQIKALLYRASRELLTNISKHAQASDVFIRIDRTDGNIRVVIEDNGKGFDLAQLEQIIHQQQGFGLFSIRERLTHVGGTFAIESKIGKGTKVTLLAPLHSANERR